jgi:hypothetical protein
VEMERLRCIVGRAVVISCGAAHWEPMYRSAAECTAGGDTTLY